MVVNLAIPRILMSVEITPGLNRVLLRVIIWPGLCLMILHHPALLAKVVIVLTLLYSVAIACLFDEKPFFLTGD